VNTAVVHLRAGELHVRLADVLCTHILVLHVCCMDAVSGPVVSPAEQAGEQRT
jgi:hypothetical protein